VASAPLVNVVRRERDSFTFFSLRLLFLPSICAEASRPANARVRFLSMTLDAPIAELQAPAAVEAEDQAAATTAKTAMNASVPAAADDAADASAASASASAAAAPNPLLTEAAPPPPLPPPPPPPPRPAAEARPFAASNQGEKETAVRWASLLSSARAEAQAAFLMKRVGACPRCCLRFAGVRDAAAYAPPAPSSAALLAELTGSEEEVEEEEEEELILLAIEDITERKQQQQQQQQAEVIKKLNKELEERVRQRTAELAAANKILEAFSYSVAHDLKAPLRAVTGFADILSEEYRAKLDDEGRRLVGVISDNVIRMGQLINDLLSLSHLSRQEMRTTDIDMTELARSVCNELKEDLFRDRVIEVSVKPLPVARADHTLTKQIFTNLISNAMKFSSHKDKALIEIGGYDKGQERVYYVKDNGAGFEMKYVDKLFGVFQRLHAYDEFSGTGIGLAIVSSAVRRHGGTVWAEGEVDKGATFYFTLPKGG